MAKCLHVKKDFGSRPPTIDTLLHKDLLRSRPSILVDAKAATAGVTNSSNSTYASVRCHNINIMIIRRYNVSQFGPHISKIIESALNIFIRNPFHAVLAVAAVQWQTALEFVPGRHFGSLNSARNIEAILTWHRHLSLIVGGRRRSVRRSKSVNVTWSIV